MSHIRLIGLVLFITTIFLGLAAITSQTSHIRVKKPSRLISTPAPSVPDHVNSTSTETPADTQAETPDPNAVEFISVPIAWPLLIASSFGLVLWFLPAPHVPVKTKSRRKRRRRSTVRR